MPDGGSTSENARQGGSAQPFVPPPYPYDRLDPIREIAARHPNGGIDLSVGTPTDPPPAVAVGALAHSNSERGYPPSIGTLELRQASADWLNSLAGTTLTAASVRATIGSKEFVAGLPHWLKLRRPDLDTILYPEVSYPSYAMGATLAGCRAVPVPVTGDLRSDLSAIKAADAKRALCLWVNSPGNPTGGLDDLGAAAAWGRANGVPVFSDECYIEFTWDGGPRSILEHGTEGVVAVHSLSKRSNLAGARAGFYAGDADLIHYLSEVRKHSGFMPPGPTQAAAVAALGDTVHVEEQRKRYFNRMVAMRDLLQSQFDLDIPMPAGAFYLWVPAPNGDAWGFAERLALELGIVSSPGEFYGAAASDHVRIALIRDYPPLNQ